MKKLGLAIIIGLCTVNSSAQTCQQEEIKIEDPNGLWVFNICKSNPTISFDDEKEYYWYNEFSKINSTKGGCGGQLLHGNYKAFDEFGNLRIERNFTLGLQDGNLMNWDSLGNITLKMTYKNGDITYMKFSDGDHWIEASGPMTTEGTVKRIYTLEGSLISEEIILQNYRRHVKLYYEDIPNQISEEYSNSIICGNCLFDSYKSYYESGSLKVEGQYFDGENTNIRVGIWKWYNQDGALASQDNYKAEVLYWPNGKIKVTGGYIFDNEIKEWLKVDEWKWYDETGTLSEKKKYRGGVEIKWQ